VVEEGVYDSDGDPMAQTYTTASSGVDAVPAIGTPDLPVSRRPPMPETPNGFDDVLVTGGLLHGFSADGQLGVLGLPSPKAASPARRGRVGMEEPMEVWAASRANASLPAKHEGLRVQVKNTFINVEEQGSTPAGQFALSCPSGVFPAFPRMPVSPEHAPAPAPADAEAQESPGDSPGKRKRRRPGVRRRRARPLLHAAQPEDGQPPNDGAQPNYAY
jgi:hypothetical protein